MPELSVITINYNNAAGLKKTIESVIDQTLQDFEYIIIDGGSTDGSVDIIKAYANNISTWVSERDNGIYHAMNKGVSRAKGDYIFFLNSGDCFADSRILKNVQPELRSAEIIYGNLLIREAGKDWIKTYPGVLYFSYFIHDSLPHSGGVFIERKAFRNELSAYDESLKIVSDWKWFLTAIFKRNYTYKYVDTTIGVFDFSGLSATNPGKLKQEKLLVLKNEFPAIYQEICELLQYKSKYLTLSSSRFFRSYSKFKKLFNF